MLLSRAKWGDINQVPVRGVMPDGVMGGDQEVTIIRRCAVKKVPAIADLAAARLGYSKSVGNAVGVEEGLGSNWAQAVQSNVLKAST